MAVLTEQERERIESKIGEVEKRTCGEIVVSVVASSGGYAWILWAWAAVGVGIASTVIGALSLGWWPFSALQLLEWQIAGACVGMLISLVPAARRIWVSKRVRAAKVHKQALAVFLQAGIIETRDRTGILIYISEFEHQVEIIADKGIHSIVGVEYWNGQVRHIVEGIRKKQAAAAIEEAVEQIGAKLAEHFPPHPDSPNELPNRVI